MRAGANPRANKKINSGKTMKEQPDLNFREHDQAVRARAINAYRWRLMRRRMVGGGCAVFAAVLLGAALLGPLEVSKQAGNARPGRTGDGVPQSNEGENGSAHRTRTDASSPARSVAREINDEELLAIFPEGSCFIAEVNGKKTLVFSDPAVRARFFN